MSEKQFEASIRSIVAKYSAYLSQLKSGTHVVKVVRVRRHRVRAHWIDAHERRVVVRSR